MYRHRLAVESDAYRLPAPRGAVVSHDAIGGCPPDRVEGMEPHAVERMLWLVEQAMEDAAALLRPSILERNLFASQN